MNSKEANTQAYPFVPSGIEVLGGKDLCQWIFVSLYHEWCVHKVLFEVFSDTSSEGKELKFRAVVVFLSWHEGVTGW